MNLTGLIEATRTRLGIPASDSYFTDQVVTDLVNAGLEYITGRHDWYWLEASESLSTTAASESVATTTSSQRTIALFDSTGVQLEFRPYHDLVRFPADAQSNTLRFFGLRGSTLILRPVPLGTVVNALTHIYRSAEPRLLSGSDTPLMPQQFHDAIADRAAYLGHLRQGDNAAAKLYQETCEEWVQLMLANADRFADSVGGGARTEGESK